MKRTRIFLSRKVKRGRQNVSESDGVGDNDRLSDLPDSILLHIMSLMLIKEAVQTCVLSKRWKGLWKCIPNLTLHTSDFSKHIYFSEFVSGIVSSRDGNSPLYNLDFDRHGYFQPKILINLMRYAVSHKIQQLKIYVPYNIGLPSFVLSCQSLSLLDISVSSYDIKRRTRIPNSIELPALKSLRLEHVAICTDDNDRAEPFSTCKMLNTLSIDEPVLISYCCSDINKSGTLVILNAKLANLTINNSKYSDYKIVVSTPKLSSFTLNGSPFQELQGQKGIKIKLQSPSSLG